MKKKLSEKEIDKIVVEQADDNSAWEEPIHIRKTKLTSLSVPAELAARAAFLARLHRETDIEKWLMHIIQERIEIEEVAFVEAKRDMAAKGNT
ncbi:hypothetical protein KAU86_02375 [bacterium]|nr:hypothetical protein [bacterium]